MKIIFSLCNTGNSCDYYFFLPLLARHTAWWNSPFSSGATSGWLVCWLSIGDYTVESRENTQYKGRQDKWIYQMVYQFDIFCTYRTQSMIRSHLLISQLKVIFHMTKKKSHAIRNWETRRRPKHLSVQLQLNERGVTISRGAVLRPNGASVITAIHWSWHPLRKGPFSIQGHYTAHKCTNNSVT